MPVSLVVGTQIIAPAMARVVLAAMKNQKGNEGKPTDIPAYKEALDMMRSFLYYTTQVDVEPLQQFTIYSIPALPSCMVTNIDIPSSFYPSAARLIKNQLGKMLESVGETWWQWRKSGSVVRAEWVEMKSDYLERKARNDPGRKVMFYIHGGAYFLGGIGHGPLLQRHARKLKGRVFAPRYRLAPQFPFPCAIQDVLSAYLYLLTQVEPSHIVIGGDSAGGGLCLSLLLILRDQGIPMPAGASFTSPWVDLTHSFPSITMPTDLDYVPAYGFHTKPSLAWPPPNADEMRSLKYPVNPKMGPTMEIEIDGKMVPLTEQYEMIAPNEQLPIPLLSGVLSPSLGGFCPCQVIVGGAEVLRDEIIYMAHKMADPAAYPPNPRTQEWQDFTKEDILRHPPTNVQLLVFDGGPHAATVLGRGNIPKYQFRAIAQFSAWALSQAQKADIEIDDRASVDSSNNGEQEMEVKTNTTERSFVGKAGDSLPPFTNNMIRHRVDFNGNLSPLQPAAQLRSCNIPPEMIGIPTQAALDGFMAFKRQQDDKFASQRKKVFEKRKAQTERGFYQFPNGEIPPPSALAGRRVIGEPEEVEHPRKKNGSMLGKIFGRFQDPHSTPVSAKPKNKVIRYSMA